MTLSIDVSASGNVYPYTLPAGWTAVHDLFQIQSGALKPAWNVDPLAIAIVTNPPTSGVLQSLISVKQSSSVFSDISGAVFCTAAGNGYVIQLNGNNLSVKPLVAKVIGSSIASTTVTYASGAAFRATYNISTNVIDVYQVSVSDVTPALTASGLTFQTGFSGGFYAGYYDSNLAGIVSVAASDAASNSIDSITSPLVLGSGGSITTTGLGTLTSLTIGGKQVSSLSATGGDGTFTATAWADGVIGFNLGSGLAVVATDGTNTANSTTTINQPSGEGLVTLTSAPATIGKLGYYGTVLSGSKVTFPTAASLGVAVNYIDVDGGIYTDYTGTQTVKIRNPSTGAVEFVSIVAPTIAFVTGQAISLSGGAALAAGGGVANVSGAQVTLSAGSVTTDNGAIVNGTAYPSGSQINISGDVAVATGGALIIVSGSQITIGFSPASYVGAGEFSSDILYATISDSILYATIH